MSDLYTDICRAYLNGEFLRPQDARVSAFDRGFIFGDGVYEVVPAYAGDPFRWEQHLQRLHKNLNTLGIASPLDREQWEALARGLTFETGGQDLYLYIQVTRGVAPRDHIFPEDVPPTVFAYSQVLHPVSESTLNEGVVVATMPDIRWQRCDIKMTSLVANVWLRQQAKEKGASEAMLIRDGVVTEGAATNVFAVLDGVVRTPAHGPDLLPGITRDLVVELMAHAGISYEERAFTESEMLAADEVWITSSTKEILPVTSIDGHAVSNGHAGPLFNQVYTLFQRYKADYRRAPAA